MMKIKFSLILLFNPLIRFANKVCWRFGRSYKCADVDVEAIRPLLKPGMVLLTHKEYELTNFFINGYWTHTAMVTPEGTVVEAISKGVVTRPLDQFLTTVDDFLVLRPCFCSPESMHSAGEHVKRFVGLPYNFTFRSKKNSVYCSELVYRAYSITPEWSCIKSSPLNDISDYHKSGRILLPHHFSESDMLWQPVRSSVTPVRFPVRE